MSLARDAVLFAALASLLTVPARALAEAAPVSDSAPPTTTDASVRDALARQAAELARLRASVDKLERARAEPLLRISGYVQVDSVLYNQASRDEIDPSTQQPLNQDRLLLRRGHVRAEAEHGLLGAVLELDANSVNGPQLRPIDAEVSLNWPRSAEQDTPRLAATLGLMKIPFGFEVPELDWVRPFLERSTSMRALFPGEFDLGARVEGRYRGLEATLAVMNGSPLGNKTFPTVAPTRRKDLVGRLGTKIEINEAIHFEAGVSAESGLGLHPGTPTTKDQVVWRDENGDGIVQATEIDVIPGAAATASQSFERFALGADARFGIRITALGELALRAEIVRSKNLDRAVEPADPIAAGRDLRELGWYLGITQEISQYCLIGARYDRYDPDEDASEQRALRLVPVDRSYSTWALLAMLRYDRARLLLEYDKNHNALGRDASGAPTNLKSDALTLRGQVTF